MATSLERIRELKELTDSGKYVSGKEAARERFARFVSTDEGWEAYLRVLAEHPGMYAWNAERLATYRVLEGLDDTFEMLTEKRVAELGGTVREGAEGVIFRERERVESEDGAVRWTGNLVSVRRWPAAQCEGLDPKRFKGRPAKCHPEIPKSMDQFVRATEDVGLDGLDEAADWCFSQRYGLSAPDDQPPAAPSAEDVDVTLARCFEVTSQLGKVCRQVDKNLRAIRHPEWAERSERDRGIEEEGLGEDDVSEKIPTISVMGSYSLMAESPVAKAATTQARLDAEALIGQATAKREPAVPKAGAARSLGAS